MGHLMRVHLYLPMVGMAAGDAVPWLGEFLPSVWAGWVQPLQLEAQDGSRATGGVMPVAARHARRLRAEQCAAQAS